MIKKITSVMLAGALALSLAACGGGGNQAASGNNDAAATPAADSASSEAPAASGASSTADASGDGTYYMITFASGIQYWTGCWKGFQEAADLVNANVEYTGATEADYAQETAIMEQVLATNPAGIAVTPADGNGMEDVINRAIDSGVPVVCFDSDSPSSNRYSYVGTDGYAAGQQVAADMAEAIGHTGKVGIVLFPGLQNQEDRAAGFEAYMAENEPNITVLERTNGGMTETEAAQGTASLIQGNPDIAGIFAVTAWTGLGSGTAILEAGKTDQIYCISFDTDEGVLDYIEDGTLDGTVAQGTEQQGFWAMMFLYCINHDTVVPGWAELNRGPVPPSVSTGVDIVKKGFTDAYR